MNVELPAPCSILLISDVLPDETVGGGHLTLYRHLDERHLGNYQSLRFDDATSPNLFGRILHRLEATRFCSLAIGIFPKVWRFGFPIRRSTLERAESADIIITVAHGRAWLVAARVARISKKPLLTLFHDWYPDASGSAKPLRVLWDHSFRQLHRSSKISLCVSDNLRNYLGPNQRSEVFPPISCDPKEKTPVTKETPVIRMIYAGYCGGAYQESLTALASALSNHPSLRLDICGPDSENLKISSPQVTVHGNLNEASRDRLFDGAAVAIVVLPFGESFRRHLSLHFPSKLIEVAGRNIPVILWGPPYASSVRWMEQHGLDRCVTEDRPEAVLATAETWSGSENARLSANRGRNLFNDALHPNLIHDRLLQIVKELCREGSNKICS